MKRKVVVFSVVAASFMLNGCSSEVKDEEYTFVETVRMLDMPPELTSPDKNLVMEFPKPSLKACITLFEANEKFKALELKRAAEEKAKKEQDNEKEKSAVSK